MTDLRNLLCCPPFCFKALSNLAENCLDVATMTSCCTFLSVILASTSATTWLCSWTPDRLKRCRFSGAVVARPSWTPAGELVSVPDNAAGCHAVVTCKCRHQNGPKCLSKKMKSVWPCSSVAKEAEIKTIMQIFTVQNLTATLLAVERQLSMLVVDYRACLACTEFLSLLQQESPQLIQVIQQRCSAAAVLFQLHSAWRPDGLLLMSAVLCLSSSCLTRDLC